MRVRPVVNRSLEMSAFPVVGPGVEDGTEHNRGGVGDAGIHLIDLFADRDAHTEAKRDTEAAVDGEMALGSTPDLLELRYEALDR